MMKGRCGWGWWLWQRCPGEGARRQCVWHWRLGVMMAVGRMTKVIIITLTCNHSRISKPFFIFVRLRFYCAVLCWYTPLPHSSHHHNPVLPVTVLKSQTDLWWRQTRVQSPSTGLRHPSFTHCHSWSRHRSKKLKTTKNNNKPTTKNCQLTNSFPMMPIRQ